MWPPSKVPRFRHQHFFNSLRSCSHDDLIASKFQGKDSTIVFPKPAIVNTVRINELCDDLIIIKLKVRNKQTLATNAAEETFSLTLGRTRRWVAPNPPSPSPGFFRILTSAHDVF